MSSFDVDSYCLLISGVQLDARNGQQLQGMGYRDGQRKVLVRLDSAEPGPYTDRLEGFLDVRVRSNLETSLGGRGLKIDGARLDLIRQAFHFDADRPRAILAFDA